jgi:hypothetical protein
MKILAPLTYLIVTSILLSSAAFANPSDGSTHFPIPSNIYNVKIVTTPSGLMTRAPLTEETLNQVGCAFYFSAESEIISEVVDILNSAFITSSGHSRTIEPRNAVYFTLRDGSVSTIILSLQNNPESNIFGYQNDGKSFKSLPLTMQSNAAERIHKLAILKSTSTNNSVHCPKHKLLQPGHN